MLDKEEDDNLLRLIKTKVLVQPRPDVVYKFCSTETAQLIVGNGTLKFDTPLNYNDPFDCQITISGDASGVDISKHLRRYSPAIGRSQRLAMIEEVKKDPDRWFDSVNGSIREAVAQAGICCFTRGWSEILLWSYYADNHKGICLGFAPNNDELFDQLMTVDYVKEHSKYNYVERRVEIIVGLLREKYHKWQHEDEVRVWCGEPGLKPFLKSSLRLVIFGCNYPDDDIIGFKQLCNMNNYNPRFYKAVKKDFAYDLMLSAV